MIPPGKTTFARMQAAAHSEAERIEIVEDGWVKAGEIAAPRPERVKLRDDYAGIVRVIDVILADDAMRGRIEDRLKEMWKQQAAAAVAAPSPATVPDDAIVPVAEETVDE